MGDIGRRGLFFIFLLIGLVGISLAQDAAAMGIGGLGAPASHPDLAGGSVIDFEANVAGDAAVTIGYVDVLMTGNNVLRITGEFNGSFNVSGNALALTTNDRTQELTFTFLSPVTAFGFNFGGADFEWRLLAYSATNSLLDERIISPFGNSNNGEWFGLAAPGIASARLYNTVFDVASNSGVLDYVVIDNFTYVNPVPEPGTVVLMGLGLVGLCFLLRCRRNQNTSNMWRN